MKKKLYLKTIGCAMNERDSEHIVAELSQKRGFERTDEIEDADLIIINTCSVREKPVQKLFSEIGAFSKKRKSGAKIGVCGCTASHLGEEIIKRAPEVSFVLGAREVSKISTIIDKEGAVEVDINYDDTLYPFAEFRSSKYKAMINISVGCDKNCSYCIVPYTRGKEISIPQSLIIDEAKRAADSGISEILLLGQNVNSYGVRFSDGSKKGSFIGLLRSISKIEGIKRIRYTSPHPLHIDDEFIEEIASNPKICKHIHLPLQSGSTKVLRDMRRGYTKEWFLNIAFKLRNEIPDLTISTDVIVAYPTESENDFLDTLEVVREVGFETMYSFIFSPRPLTPAEKLKSDISQEVAKERLKILQDLQKEVAIDRASKRLGKVYEVLCESINQEGLVEGRSSNNYLIRFKGDSSMIGSYKKVRIDHLRGASLLGKALDV